MDAGDEERVSMYCQRRRTALDTIADRYGRRRYRHTVANIRCGYLVATDHEPDPVPLYVLTGVHMRCDIRSASGPQWMYRTRAPIVDGPDNSGSFWAMCGDCAACFDGGDLYGLTGRALAELPLHVRQSQRAALVELYRRLLAERVAARGRIDATHPFGVWPHAS